MAKRTSDDVYESTVGQAQYQPLRHDQTHRKRRSSVTFVDENKKKILCSVSTL